ncbi:MAG: aldehyde ferredoxin oxidoreductase, partial [Chloroflexi bacterium]|nr:aldehyde ferredoxin oxidoreductase [Chloroflexota bacterium]
MNGWAGQILRVDLSKGHWADEELNVDLAEKYIGGRGLASKVLFDEVNPKASPLGPENKLIFMTGPLAGTGAPSACRFSVVAKSPLTGTISCSTAGGFFGPELKFAGYDGIIFEGKAPKPAYLWINNDKIEIRAADHLWGKDVSETVDLIQHEIGDKWQAWDTHVAAIGPAGENLVRFAAIMGDKWRAAARGGMGAVMGYIIMKSIALRGTGAVTVSVGTGFKEITLAIRGRIK